MKEDIHRAAEMLRIAAEYIKQHCPDGDIFYDEADCDGYCVAADCEIAADELLRGDESNESLRG